MAGHTGAKSGIIAGRKSNLWFPTEKNHIFFVFYLTQAEVQLLPKARQAIKYLVADGRYKYIETGSLLSIKKNTKDILIPSEEYKISMYPMDFEEFLWAIGDEITADTIKILLKNKKTAGNALHRNLMRIFR